MSEQLQRLHEASKMASNVIQRNLHDWRYNELGKELRKLVDYFFSYNARIHAMVVYTDEGILVLKRPKK